jgi:hypothetical protein
MDYLWNARGTYEFLVSWPLIFYFKTIRSDSDFVVGGLDLSVTAMEKKIYRIIVRDVVAKSLMTFSAWASSERTQRTYSSRIGQWAVQSSMGPEQCQ